MNTNTEKRRFGRALVGVLVLPLLGIFTHLSMGKADASGEPEPAASASVSASGSASPQVPKEWPLFLGKDIPQEPSAKPTQEEWDTIAVLHRANRSNIEGCYIRSLREWLRMECSRLSGATLVAGSKKGVEMAITGTNLFGIEDAVFVVITTPLRRGQSQIYSLLDLDFDYESTMFGEAATMSILWREGQEDPVIVLASTD